ncbi:uncharacterized protein F5147DRAFT_766626 [Suillus discolor]|uniref:Uncharacterized protein n=1 Tax=Suillus discolor TaxID=1912936 RepID=A0A9P7FL51_9AGAM|nr:uncharacterized protein F5147DRAFT_766626 [Suillus discolor]KAG2120730.1 hypothetical protein F5147DRAFT_766626 [Suillus discolor]
MRISTVVLVFISMMLGIIGVNAHPALAVRGSNEINASGMPPRRVEPSMTVAANGLPPA